MSCKGAEENRVVFGDVGIVMNAATSLCCGGEFW